MVAGVYSAAVHHVRNQSVVPPTGTGMAAESAATNVQARRELVRDAWWGEGARMKDVWEACRFSSDIVSADFSKAKFAVELHEFLDGTADRMYQDPQTFFGNTFLTDQMKMLVRDTLTRLSAGSGQPVTVIDTGFGGGKTHSLLLLHHILCNPDKGLDFVRKHGMASDAGISSIPKARIIEIDCRKITKNTLWGEIAHRFGRYAEFETLDARREAPMDITVMKRLLDGPVLVMLDELPQYLFKADGIKVGKKTLGEITIPFIMELISAVASSPQACLILTLTEKQSLYEAQTADILSRVNTRISDFRVDELVSNLNEAIARQANVMTPVNRGQIYDVVNARLVQHVDKEAKAAAIREYAAYYEKYGMDVGDMLEKMERSYPFHPSLIDILHDRVSTIGKFNQTRGMLRLLARVVRQVTEDKRAGCQMIGTSDMRFDNTEIRDELTVRLGLDLGIVMDTDCVGHAREADGAKSTSVVEPIASAIMLFSLHGDTRKSGMRRGHIKAAVGRPGLDPSLVDKALDEDVTNGFWYIHDVGGQEFYFDEFPNINAIIHEHRQFVTASESRDVIRQALAKLLPTGAPRAVLWDPGNLTDDDELKLFVAEYGADLTGDEGMNYLKKMLYESGDVIRSNKNTIIVVYADPEHVQFLERTAKTLVAIQKAKKDERVKADRQFTRDMAGKETDAAAQLSSDCLRAYTRVMYPRGADIRRGEARFGESRSTTITGVVTDLLANQGKLIRTVSPDGLEVGDKPVKIGGIYRSFAEDMSKPFVLDKKSIGEAVRQGLLDGKFGYCTEIVKAEDGKYVVKKGVVDFDWDGFLVDEKMTYKPPAPPPPPYPEEKGNLKGGPHAQNRFKYEVRLEAFEQIRQLVMRSATLNLNEAWKSSQKKFRAELRIGSICMTITDDTMSNYRSLKDVLNAMSGSDPDGTATVHVAADSDLEAFFKENNVGAWVRE